MSIHYVSASSIETIHVAKAESNYEPGTADRAVIDAIATDYEDRGILFEDRGISFHVLDKGSGDEFLRFDCFEHRPHYHYIEPGIRSRNMDYDAAVNGEDMVEWTLGRLADRLPEMLASTGANALSARVDRRIVAEAMPKISAAVAQRLNGRDSD